MPVEEGWDLTFRVGGGHNSLLASGRPAAADPCGVCRLQGAAVEHGRDLQGGGEPPQQDPLHGLAPQRRRELHPLVSMRVIAQLPHDVSPARRLALTFTWMQQVSRDLLGRLHGDGATAGRRAPLCPPGRDGRQRRALGDVSRGEHAGLEQLMRPRSAGLWVGLVHELAASGRNDEGEGLLPQLAVCPGHARPCNRDPEP